MATTIHQSSTQPAAGKPPVLRVFSEPAPPSYEALLGCLGDLVFRVDATGIVEDAYCPDDYEFPLAPSQVVGRTLQELLPVALAQKAMDHLALALESRKLTVFSLRHEWPGRVREYQVRLQADGSGRVQAVVRDVTGRRLFEKEILEVNHRIQLRIGQDLHDGLGQHLTGITFLSKALERKLVAQGMPEAEEAAEIGRLVIQVLAQTRNLARSLFPVEIEAGGLVRALRELTSSVETFSKISCRMEVGPDVEVNDPQVSVHLFRLTQEAVNNAVTHGQAQSIMVRLTQEEGELRLSIADDGKGFGPSGVCASGLGIRIMQYRAQRIGGQLTIESVAPHGTEVLCCLPWKGDFTPELMPGSSI